MARVVTGTGVAHVLGRAQKPAALGLTQASGIGMNGHILSSSRKLPFSTLSSQQYLNCNF